MLLLMLACLTTEDEYEALMDRAMDSDGDGHIAAEHGGDDCDDDDALVAPGLDETCDEKDNDCDSDVDEDASDAGTSTETGTWMALATRLSPWRPVSFRMTTRRWPETATTATR